MKYALVFIIFGGTAQPIIYPMDDGGQKVAAYFESKAACEKVAGALREAGIAECFKLVPSHLDEH